MGWCHLAATSSASARPCGRSWPANRQDSWSAGRCPSAHGIDRAVDAATRAALEPDPYLRLPSVAAFVRALGAGLGPAEGASLGRSIDGASAPLAVLETIARSAAGVFGAAAASVALVDRGSGELVYASSWGTGAEEIVGVRLPRGTGIAGAVLVAGEPEAIESCRDDPRFARHIANRTGYVPNTMLVLPMIRGDEPFGILQILDRRDGVAFGPADIDRGAAFVELAIATLDSHGGDTREAVP